MGGSLSTIRWTPYGPLPGSSNNDRNKHSHLHNNAINSNRKLRKSKSFPPNRGNEYPSPSNSTSNLSGSYDNDNNGGEYSPNDHYHHHHHHGDELLYNNNQTSTGGGGDHLGTSGILMGVNAPPLYDACLVGRWEEVLDLCGVAVPSSSANNDGAGGANHGGGEEEEESHQEGDMSDDSPKTGTTHCSSSNEGEDPGFPSVSRLSVNTHNNNGDDDDDDDETSQTSTQNSQHPCLQTRYADRRRNTPLHLACRRQPPPLVVQTLLNHSPCEAVSRRTADGLTPLHFAAYCGAGVEVVSMLVDRMRSDAAVGRAMRLSLRLNEEGGSEVNNNSNNNNNNEGHTNAKDNSNRSGDNNGRWRLPSEESSALPPTRLLDRRRRTPLHCALSGFRTPIRPVVVRKLLAVDPASATLGDERGRTPLSLLFDDYAEEIMEALEEDVANSTARERIREGGELHECWRMLTVLLQAAYRGSVSEDERGEGANKGIATAETTEIPLMRTPKQQQQQKQSMTHPISAVIPEVLTGSSGSHDDSDDNDSAAPTPTPTPHNTPQPQDRQQSIKEVNVVEMYDQEHFSMVHAAAGVWECPAPLAKLVLKCLCGGDDDGVGKSKGTTTTTTTAGATTQGKSKESPEEWDHHDPVDLSDRDFPGRDEVENNNGDEGYDDVDPIQQPDEETMRLPLHIAVCARPQGREGYSARLKAWLSSTPETANSLSTTSSSSPQRSNSRSSTSLATHPDRGRSPTTNPAGQVYNPRFGRSPSRDSVVAYSQSTKSMRRGRSGHGSNGGGGGGGGAPGARGFISRSGSNASISANIAREPFLQHTMVRDVLALHPHAASVVDDRTGKLPIVLAIEHGKSWETAVGPLLEAYPQPFGGGGDGGMALPDDGPEGRGHREDLQAALFVALSSPEIHVRDEAIRTAGKLAKWGGVYGMPGSLDGIVSEWLDTMANHGNIAADGAAASSSPASPEGIVVGPGAAPWSSVDPYQTQSSHLTAVAEVISHSRPESVSDRVARLCLDASREYLFSKDGSVREAAARVLGNTLNSVGDADDAANVMREVVLNMTNDEGSVVTVSSKSVFGANRDNEESVIAKHGRLLACNSILSTQWGSDLVVTPDICDAIIAFIHGCVKDRNNNTVVRSAAYHAVGPLLGKSGAIATHTDTLSRRTSTSTLKEMRSDILKGTRASEHVDVQVALARGLTAASRMHPGIFLCKGGMPVMDAALMLAMSSSVKRPQVQKAFQIFLWVALQMGGGGGGGNGSNDHEDGAMYAGTASGGGGGNATMSSPGLERYIELAEGENGRIMMKFVTQTLAKIEDLDDQGGMC